MDELYVETPVTEETVDVPEMEIQDAPQIFLNHEGVVESKPKGNVKIIAVISAVVVAFIVAVLLLWKPVANLLGFSQQSPRDQFIYVETQYYNDCVDSISAWYGDFMACLEEGMFAGESEIKLQLGDQIVDVLSAQIGTDISWLDDVSIRMNTATDLRYVQITMIPVVGEEDLFSIDLIYDSQEQRILVGVPEMSGTYIVGDDIGDTETAPVTPIDKEMIRAFVEAMPTEQTVNTLLRKYLKSALSAIKTVSRKTEKVTIEGITQECTVLETQLDTVTYTDMIIAVLQEAKQGAELYSVVEKIADFAAPYEEIPSKAEWNMEIDKIITALEEEKATADIESVVTWKIYLDSKDRLIGLSSEVSDTGDYARYVTVRKGDKFAYEQNIGNMFVVVGSGVDKNSNINGEFRLLASGMEMATVELIDLDSKKFDNHELSGTVRVKASKLVSQLLFNTSVDAELTLELVFDDENMDGGFSLNAYIANELLVGIGMNLEQLTDYSIDIPSKIIDSNDEEAINNWFNNWNAEKVYENMKNAGIPQELLVSLFMSALNLEEI